MLRPDEVVLEVGCGSGVLDRWLARYTKANRIIGVDVNRYLLREAKALARSRVLPTSSRFRKETQKPSHSRTTT
jgi:cyclopropane fatty-acyl-phospholipid synthase-like methyltransferase